MVAVALATPFRAQALGTALVVAKRTKGRERRGASRPHGYFAKRNLVMRFSGKWNK